ncbi:MAG: NeuD/PglB/VioB family sugar acetyltransferase [Acidimicrobiia bacterium]|nr:NeuD/PglB/VioB family sugar acetyltransferase [Acidimicrobiia bacterium]
MTPLVIVGAGGHGRECLDVLEAVNAADPTWDFLGFLDDGPVDEVLLDRRRADFLGPTTRLEDLDARYVLGIGASATRARLDDMLTAWGRDAARLVHPDATIASDNTLADGVVIAAGGRVTTNVRLGRHAQVNVNAVVSHDCRVGSYCTLSPGVHLNGNVTVGERVFFGTGAIVTPGVTIGDDVVVGAGAVVLHDVADHQTVVGAPARPR